MISSRLPKSFETNALTRAVAAKRRGVASIVDLTETNPTAAGFAYPQKLLEPLANPRALEYEPQAPSLLTFAGAAWSFPLTGWR